MRAKSLIAVSPACLVLLSQCAAAPVNNIFHPHHEISPWLHQVMEANNGDHVDASRGHGSWIDHINAEDLHPGGESTNDPPSHFPVSSKGRRHDHLDRSSHQVGDRADYWVHPDLNRMFQEAGLPTVPGHRVSNKEKEVQHDLYHEERGAQSLSQHENDGLWAIVGESSKRFGSSTKPTSSRDTGPTSVSQETPLIQKIKQKQKGVLKTSDDPNNWRYKLPQKTIAAVHAKFRQLIGPNRHYASLNHYLNKKASQKDALDLLSADHSMQMAALGRIGVPVERSGGARKLYWGDQKNAITKRIEDATGMQHDQLVKKLSNRLHKELAEKLMSDDKKKFTEGIEEFLNEQDRLMIAGMPTQKRRKTSLE